MSDYFRQHFVLSNVEKNGWVALSEIGYSIKRKIESIGTPLKDWGVQINYGIKTGFNDAYIIDAKKREELLGICANSVEIIRPILLGKNLKRYSYEYDNLHLINCHNGIKSTKAERVDVSKYPAIFEHLKRYKDDLTKRQDQGDHWTNLRNCAYLMDFEQPKIAWGNLATSPQFCLIPKGFIINAPSPFFVSDSLYLLGVLNSKVCAYFIKNVGVSRSGGYIEFKPMFVELMPIPNADVETQKRIANVVSSILKRKENGQTTQDLEAQIDEILFEVYQFTTEEKSFLRS